MIEFALIVPLLLMLVTGIMYFGIVFDNYLTLTDAASNGARNLALGRGVPDNCTVAENAAVTSASQNGLTITAAKNLQATVTQASGSPVSCGTATSVTEAQGQQATVTLSYTDSISIFGFSLPSIPLSASASYVVE